jgi:hypothetical protein
VEAVVTVVNSVNGAFTVDEADTTFAAGEVKIAGVDDGETDVDGDADAGKNDGAVGGDGSDAGDGTGTPDKTVLPNGCALGDDSDGATAPGAGAFFPC